jgi:hypothetical protein
MNTTDKTAITKPGNPTGKNSPARAGRFLSVVRTGDERALHLSPILRQIKDDGPALLDGELLPNKDGARKREAANSAPESKAPQAQPVPAPLPVPPPPHSLLILGFCALLTLGLGCTLYFTWQQQARLETMESLLLNLASQH